MQIFRIKVSGFQESGKIWAIKMSQKSVRRNYRLLATMLTIDGVITSKDNHWTYQPDNTATIPVLVENYFLNRRGYGYDDAHVGYRLDAVGFPDVRDKHVTGFGRYSGLVLAEEFPLPFNDQNGQLSVKIMGMNGKDNTGSEIEVNDSEIG